MPIRILPDTEKRKAKRGVTPGKGVKWPKRPYKDYTKIKHTNLIQTLDGRKKGQIQEQGPPGTEKKLHDKSMKRLNELQKLKSREGTRMTSGAQKKRKEHLQKGGYKAGGRAGFKHGKFVSVASPHVDVAKYVDKITGEELEPERGRSRIKGSEEKVIKKLRRSAGPGAVARRPIAGRQGRKEARKALQIGGRIGLKHGSGRKTLTKTFEMPTRKTKDFRKRLIDKLVGGVEGKPHSSPAGQAASVGRKIKRISESKPYQKGGRTGLKHGSSAQEHYTQHGYGPHKIQLRFRPHKIQLRSGKPKLAKKGW